MKKRSIIKIVVLVFVMVVTVPVKQIFAVNYSVDGKPMASNTAVLEKELWKASNLSNDIDSLMTLDKAQIFDCKIVFNGQTKSLSLPCLNADGRTYLPFRALAEEILDATVEYDGTHGIAIVIRGETEVETFAGSNKVVVNGTIKAIDPNNSEARAFLRDERTYVPVRAVSEALGGLTVEWDGATSTIIITEGDDMKAAEWGNPSKPEFKAAETWPSWSNQYYQPGDPEGWTRNFTGGPLYDANGYDARGYDKNGVDRNGKTPYQNGERGQEGGSLQGGKVEYGGY